MEAGDAGERISMEMDTHMPVADRDEEFTHAAEKLQLGALLELIAAFARSERCKARILASGRIGATADVERSQRRIAELLELRRSSEHLPLDGWRDSWQDLNRIRAAGAVADAEELARIAEGERATRRVSRFCEAHAERAPSLREYRSWLDPQDDVIERIAESIGPDHTVLDGASASLSRVRKNISRMRSSLRKSFADFAAQSGSGKGYEFVTVRGERFVVSLPRGEAAHVGGIVHHESGSGASVYIEPLEFVEDNNRLEYLVQDERREVARILGMLTAAVFAKRDVLMRNQDALCMLDGVASKAAFAERYRCRAPMHSTDGTLVLRDARHPLLEKRCIDDGAGATPVPLNITCGQQVRAVVVSGPNAGGKTVALKTIGLLVMMDGAGLLLPAREGTIIPAYGAIFVDIGDDQSIEMSLSTFSSRIERMKKILESVKRTSLVLVDEIGDGTDPEEGAALAEALLDRLMRRAGRTIVTTHLSALKGWAHETEGAVNATLEFDPEKLEPLFTFRMGVPGRSWGIDMAARMGLPREVIDDARAGMGEHVVRLEELIAHLERTAHAVERERETLMRKEGMLSDVIASYRKRLDSFTRNRDEMEQKAREEALEIVTATRREMERLVRDIRTRQAERDVIRESKRTIRRRREQIEEKIVEPASAPHFTPEQLREGMSVEVGSLSRAGKVLSVKGDSRVILELTGGLRVETSIDDVLPHRGEGDRPPTAKATWSAELFEPVSTELMVRGLERAEAIERVDYFIDRAVLQGLRRVVIIHGLGKGILRRAVYDMLKKDPRVRDVHPGEPAIGGDGVAVVELK